MLLVVALLGVTALVVRLVTDGDKFVATEDESAMSEERKRARKFDSGDGTEADGEDSNRAGDDDSDDSDGENGANGKNSSKNSSKNAQSGGSSTREGEAKQSTDSNGDIITTKVVYEEQAIAFGIDNRDEQNLPRGEVKVYRAGETGVRTLTYQLTYKNGELLMREEVASEVTKVPVNQINLVGMSDYNLNDSYIQLYRNATVYREGRSAAAFMILVNGNFYMDFWYDPVTWKGYAPSPALMVGGGELSYDGATYTYDAGPVDESFALNMAFCSEYGLACGSW